MLPNVPGNVAKHSGECPQTIKKILENMLGHVVKHPVESIKAFRRMHVIVLDTADHELLPICWRAVTVKFYFQAAGLYFILGNWKLWLIFQKRSEAKERNREKRSLMIEGLKISFS